MQLDLFTDSRDVMLRNDLSTALLAGDFRAASAATAALAAEFPTDAVLPDAALLLDDLRDADDLSPWPDPDPALATRERLVGTLSPAARRVFGPDAAAGWLARQWAWLARRAGGLPYSDAAAAVHPAALWIEAGQWQAAAEAVERIESWRRMPQPLAWMARARCHLDGVDATWPLLAELAWMAPAGFKTLAHTLRDAAGDPFMPWRRLLRGFDAGFEPDARDAADALGDALAWLPAWALTDQPGLAERIELAQPGTQTRPEQATRLMLALLRLERQGRHREVIEHRRQLINLHDGLFRAYMKTR